MYTHIEKLLFGSDENAKGDWGMWTVVVLLELSVMASNYFLGDASLVYI